MKLVIAVIITTIKPRYPISDSKNDVKFKAKPSKIIAKGNKDELIKNELVKQVYIGNMYN